MGIAVKNNTVIAVETEVTEGTYLAPTASSSFVQTLADGSEMTPAKELIERNVFNGSIGKSTPRTGTKSVSGSLPVEYRSAEVEGSAPEYDKLLLSAMGQKRSMSVALTTDTGHTTSVINIQDGDIGDINVGDIVMIKQTGAYHVSPVSAVDDTLGAANITLLIPMAAAPADGVQIARFTTYVTADSGHPSLSVSKYVENAVLEQAAGCKVTSMALESFETGQISSLNFAFEGMSFDRSLTAPPFPPQFDSSLPPIILEACVWQNSTKIAVNSLSLSLENTLGFVTSTCSANGRISSRVTERSISGSINPYKQDDSVAQFNRFKCNEEFSIFAFAKIPVLDVNCNPTGEFSQVVAIYIPKCFISEIAESDQDGLLQDELSFVASRGTDGQTEELYMGFI
jgi:hypothetical protein